MELLQAIGGGCFLLMSAALSIRLLQLARRNRAVPELLLGSAFLLGGTLGATLEAAGPSLAPEVAGRLVAVGKALGGIGIALNALFTWWVFRRGESWATALLVGLVALLTLGYFVNWQSGTFQTGMTTPDAFWLEFVGRVASPIWLGSEAVIYWSRMRRRSRIGLADPLVQNRFLLWALASFTGVLLIATSAAPVYARIGSQVADANLAAFGVLGIATAALYWLAFFPPEAYRRRICASAP